MEDRKEDGNPMRALKQCSRTVKLNLVMLIAITIGFYVYGELHVDGYEKGIGSYDMLLILIYSLVFVLFLIKFIVDAFRGQFSVYSAVIISLIAARVFLAEEYHYIDMMTKAIFLNATGTCESAYEANDKGMYGCYSNVHYPRGRFLVINPSGYVLLPRNSWPKDTIDIIRQHPPELEPKYMDMIYSCGYLDVFHIFGDIYYIEAVCQ